MDELLTLEQLRALPNDCMAVKDPVIYFLWRDDELLYIGATQESDVRIARHIRDRNSRRRPIMFNRYTFLELSDP